MARNSEITRTRLLEAACERLVETNGLIEVADIAKTATVSVGLVYHHFGSKAGLIAAVVEKFYDDMEVVLLSEPVETGAAWLQAEEHRLQRAVGFFYRSPLAPYMLTRLSRDAEVADIERQRLAEQIEMGSRNIARGQQLGSVDKQLDPEITVTVLLIGLRHAIARALDRSPRLPEAVLREQLWSLVTRVLNSPKSTAAVKKPKAPSKVKVSKPVMKRRSPPQD
jgi:AcrR family transcriptional regulator